MNKRKTPDNNSMAAVLAALDRLKEDVNERFEDLEGKKKADDGARKYIAERLFNPDRKHLAEMTNNPLRSITARADAVAAGSILDDDVQSGEVSIGQKWQEEHDMRMRGLRGNLMEKAKELALEEAKGEREQEPYDEAKLGTGV